MIHGLPISRPRAGAGGVREGRLGPVDAIRGACPPEIEYATTHADSLLFASAISLIVALLIEELAACDGALYLVVLPVIVAGVIANNRRVAWVALAWAFASLLPHHPVDPPQAPADARRAALSAADRRIRRRWFEIRVRRICTGAARCLGARFRRGFVDPLAGHGEFQPRLQHRGKPAARHRLRP